ncbi:cysteine rich repeat-containing protein [Acuticoccus yangtzensis]|uniref:cysteine rich repeat-containing protein n=1 Tax=Acuticoccus yangtzensis TaxID=1443441 RepID=UPI000949724B|nr:cysteine rich repeat-containing protein [Acuticoccus yangtzensis]
MKSYALSAVILAALTFGAAPSRAADVLDACSADIASLCGEVEPGNGRVMACLYAFESSVSDACDAAIADTADILDTMFASLSYARQMCMEDAASLCGDVEAGEGRVLSCLKEKEAELSDGCAEIMTSVMLPDDEDGAAQ